MGQQTADDPSGRRVQDRISIDADLLTDEAVWGVEDANGEIRLYQERPEMEVEEGGAAVWHRGDSETVVRFSMSETRHYVEERTGKMSEIEGHSVIEVGTDREIEWYEVLPTDRPEWTALSLVN